MFRANFNIGTDAQSYKYAMKNAYDYGYNGLSYDDAKISTWARNVIGNDKIKAAYEAGKADHRADIAQKQRAIDNSIGTATIRQGLLRLKSEAYDSLSHEAKSDLSVYRAISAGTGCDINIVTDEEFNDISNGKSEAEAFYDPNSDRIYIPARTMNNTEKTALYAVTHELVHWAKEKSPALYDELKSFVFDTLKNDGISVESVVANKVLQYADHNISLDTEQATDEIIAETCSRMLDDNKLISQMMNENRTLLEKIVDKIGEIIERITSALHEMFGSAEQDSEEYQLYLEAGGTFEALQERFNKMLYDASNVSKKSGVQTEYESGEIVNDEGDLRFKIKNDNYNQVDNKRKSIYNEFNTLAMQWAYNSGTISGDMKIISRGSGEFVLIKATDDGFVELSSGSYERMKSLEQRYKYADGRRYFRKAADYVYEQPEISGAEEDGHTLSVFNDGSENNAESMGQIGERRLQTNTATGNEHLRTRNREKYKNKAGVENTSAFSNGEKEQRYSFAGEKAETSNASQLSEAKQMEKDGADSEEIRRKTGWFRGYDNKWRFEINDYDSELIKKPKLEEHYSDGEKYFTGKLADILKHNELFKAYPQLKDFDVVIQKTDTGVGGIAFDKQIVLSEKLFERKTKEYSDYLNGGRKTEIEKIEQTPEYKEYNKFYDDPDFENIEPEQWLEEEKAARDKFFNSELGKRYYQLKWGKTDIRKYELGWSDKAKSVLMHEIQHEIQDIEGLAKGSNPEYWNERIQRGLEVRSNDKRIQNAEKEYRRIFESAPNEFKEKIREMNRAIISQDYDTVIRIEDELYDSKYADLYSELSMADFERRGDRGDVFTSSDLYRNTAGEIEARDVSHRLDLNREQRKNTRPDIDRTDVVFADSGASYEINREYAETLDSWNEDGRPDNESFVLGSTGSILQGLGARENDIYINGNKIKTILREHPEIDIDVIKRIPEILENPVLVLSSKNSVKNNSRMVMFGRVTAENGKPVLCVLDLMPRENKIVLNDMQKAVSAYSKTNGEKSIKNFFENSDILYVSKNKKITANLLTRVGFYMPTDLQKSGYIGSITYENEKVNIKGVPFNEVFSYDTDNSISKKSSNDTSNFRYSISSDDKAAQQESKNLEEENQELKHRLHESEVEQDRLKREMTLSEFTTKDDPSVNSFAKSLRKKYGSTMSTAELHQRLNDIYYHLAKRGGVASNIISDKCLKLADDIASTATQKAQGEFWNDLRGYFKDKKITLAEQDRNDVGDWQSFRKKYQQSFGLRNEGGLPVDVVYMELHEQFPGLFDDTITHPADQLKEIAEVYESQRPYKESPYKTDEEQAQAVKYIAREIYDAYKELEDTAPTFADKAQDKIIAQKVAYEKKTEQLKGELNKNLGDVKKKYKDSIEWYRESRRMTDLKKSIRRLNNELQKALIKPTDRVYVPVDMFKPIAEVAKMIDVTTSDETTNFNQKQYAAKAAIDMLIAANEKYSPELNPGNGNEEIYDPGVIKGLQTLKDEVGDKNINAMTADELNVMYNALRDMRNYIRDSVVQLGKEQTVYNIDIANDIAKNQLTEQVIDTAKDKNKAAEFFGKVTKFERFSTLNPIRIVKMISGWVENSGLVKQVDELNDGVRKMNKWKMKQQKLFGDYTDGKYKEWYYKACNKPIDTGIMTLSGGPLNMTKMQIMQTVMSAKRESINKNLNHMATGGITVADAVLYNKGNIEEAWQKANILSEISNDKIKHLESLLDENDRAFMKKAEKFFNEEAPKAINEVSRTLKHRDVAVEQYYLPFVVDKNFISGDLTGLKMDATLENSGFMKSTVKGAQQPLMIMGLDNLINAHIRDVGKLYGLAVPIRNFNKVYNSKVAFSDSGRGETVKSLIYRNWGKQGTQALEQMIADLQTSRKDTDTFKPIASKIRNVFTKAALVGNISVVIKQAASYATAGSEISIGSLNRALPTFGKYFFSKKYREALHNEIDAHTAQHYQRRLGMSTQELGDIATANTLLKRFGNRLRYDSPKATQAMMKAFDKISPEKWIQAMDCATTAAIWNACKIEVEIEVENDKNNGLKKGLKKGSEEYWNRITSMYDSVIENTQPMYDVLHRTEIQKTNSNLIKSAFMFQTQPLQNAGILYDAYGELRQAMSSGKGKRAAALNFAKAAGSQAASLLTFVTMTLAANVLLHRMNRYRKKEGEKKGEITIDSVLMTMLGDMMSNGSNLALPLVGQYVTGVSMRLIDKNNTYYGIEDNSRAFIKEYRELVIDTTDKLKKLNEVNNDESADDEEKQKAWENAREDLKDFAIKFSELFGIPATNINKLFEGVGLHVQDIANGQPFSFNAGYDMPNGEYAPIGDDELAKEIESELAKNGAGKVTKAQSSIQIDGESVKLSRDEYADYAKARQEYMKQLLKGVMSSSVYGSMNKEQKSAALNNAKTIANANAKADATKYTSDTFDKERKLKESGVSYADQAIAQVLTSVKYNPSADTDNSGTMSQKEKQAAINNSGFSQQTKELLIAYYKQSNKKKG